MKKLILSIGLIAEILSASAQDTTCTYFTGERVIEFNYYTDTILYEVEFGLGGELQTTKLGKFYEINLDYGQVLCLDLSDEKNRVRNVIITYFDGTTRKDVLKSKDNVYYSPQGAVKISVGRSRIALINRY